MASRQNQICQLLQQPIDKSIKVCIVGSWVHENNDYGFTYIDIPNFEKLLLKRRSLWTKNDKKYASNLQEYDIILLIAHSRALVNKSTSDIAFIIAGVTSVNIVMLDDVFYAFTNTNKSQVFIILMCNSYLLLERSNPSPCSHLIFWENPVTKLFMQPTMMLLQVLIRNFNHG